MQSVIVAIIWAIVGQEQARVRPDVGPDQEYLRYEEGFRPRQGGAYTNLMISPPIGLKEWGHYEEIMHLSEAQRHALAAAYDTYRRNDWAFRVTEAQPLWDQSSAFQASAVSADLEAAKALVDLFDRAYALEPRIVAIENVFFAEISSVASDQQSRLLDTVRLRRDRLRAQQVRMPFPGYQFDVDMALYEMTTQGLDCTPTDQQTWNDLISSWRQSATAMHEQFAKVRRKGLAENVLFPAQLNAMVAKDGATQAAYAFAEEQHRLGIPSMQAARSLLDLNKQYVNLLAAQLPQDTAQHLRDRFDLAAYPALFPDPADMRRVFDTIGGLDLNQDQRTTIEGIRIDCETTNAATLDVMKRDYLAWKEKTCIRSGFIFDEYNPYADDMQRMQQARIDKCKAAILALETTLTPDQLNAIRGEYELWRGWLESFEKKRQAVIERHGRWPGPYD